MSWHKLNHHEFQAIRKLLMLSARESALYIGKLAGKNPTRTWQAWESGKKPIPCDVEQEMYGLIEIRNRMIGNLTAQQVKCEVRGEVFTMPYYHTFDEYTQSHPSNKVTEVDWKIHQSAVAVVFAEGGDVKLI